MISALILALILLYLVIISIKTSHRKRFQESAIPWQLRGYGFESLQWHKSIRISITKLIRICKNIIILRPIDINALDQKLEHNYFLLK